MFNNFITFYIIMFLDLINIHYLGASCAKGTTAPTRTYIYILHRFII